MSDVSPHGRLFARSGFAPSLSAVRHDMTADAPHQRVQHVLVITDLSPSAANAAWRGALIARDRRVPLHLLSLQTAGGAVPVAQSAVDTLAKKLRNRLHITVQAYAHVGSMMKEGAEAARKAGLLVVAASSRNLLADWLLGCRLQRLMRRCATPVLVVRRPAFESYRSVIVPVELGPAARGLIAAARTFSRDPGMKVFHVLGTGHEETMRLADVPERFIHAERQKRADRARRTLMALIKAAAAREDGAIATVAFGHAADRILEEELSLCAELLVLGKRPAGALTDFLFGSVTRRVLSATRADVLVMPLPRNLGSFSSEGARMSEVQLP